MTATLSPRNAVSVGVVGVAGDENVTSAAFETVAVMVTLPGLLFGVLIITRRCGE